MSRFIKIFDKEKKHELRQQNFQARLFGIFNEEIVHIWAESEIGGYRNLGRPTVYLADGKHHTFDFLLQKGDKNFLTEMKCWLPFEKYAYFELDKKKQLDDIAKNGAFKVFMQIAEGKLSDFIVKVSNKGMKEEISIDSVILIWGTVKREKKEEIKTTTGIHEILALEDIIEELLEKQNPEYIGLVEKYRKWSNSFFDMLVSKET